MNDFTASNGIEISVTDGASGTYLLGRMPTYECADQTHATGSVEGIQALREFFQAEADERLGRWRSHIHPEFFVVWAHEGETIHVCSDRFPAVGSALGVQDRGSAEEGETVEHEVAREFFDAHPEPKPWTRAKDGESWYLTITSLGPETSIRWTAQGSPVRFWAGGLHISADSDEITDGRPVNVGMS